MCNNDRQNFRFRLERNVQVIQYAPKIPKPEDVQIKHEKSEVVPKSYLDDTCDFDVDIAEPTKEEEVIDLVNCDHWADVAVTEASDEENIEKAQAREYLKPKKTKSQKQWYVCYLCNYQSEIEDLLIKHMIRKHTSMDGDCFLCGFCKYECQSEDLIQNHLIAHVPEKRIVDNSWKYKFAIDTFGEIHYRRLRKEHIAVLEEVFKRHYYLQKETRLELAKKLNVNDDKIRGWFKRRRRLVRRRE